MKAQRIADLYSDYLLASFGATTATGLSELLEGEVSHDQVTRYVAGTKKTASALWRTVKSFVREVPAEAGGLILDDSLEAKPYTDENDIVCWHYDPSKDRLLKGINCLTALYSSQGVSVPVGCHLVAKTETYLDPKTQKEKRRSDYLCPLKTNRRVALSKADKPQGRYVRVDTLELEAQATREISLEGVDFPLVLLKQVFTNEDGSISIRYLVSSETTLSFDDVTTTYHNRWGVECYHKSLKPNVALAKSPPPTVTTQPNHFFAALWGFIKLERLKMKTQLNHFTLKSNLYLHALHSAFATLRALTPVQGSA